MTHEDDATFELSFTPDVGLIGTVCRFVEDLCGRVTGSASIASRLVVTTHELLENAFRYSTDGRSKIRVGVARASGECRVSIAMTNRTDSEHRAELLELLQELGRSPDRSAAYQALMRRSAKRETGSGLGLGRIYAESEMDLRCDVEGDEVHLVAEAVIAIEGGETMSGATDQIREAAKVPGVEIANIETPELTTQAAVTKTHAAVTMVGTAETTAMEMLIKFLQQLHDRVTTDRIADVTIDVRALQFITSSCFKAFVGWIDRLQSLPSGSQYCVTFKYDEGKHWQRRSLGALAALGADVVRLES